MSPWIPITCLVLVTVLVWAVNSITRRAEIKGRRHPQPRWRERP